MKLLVRYCLVFFATTICIAQITEEKPVDLVEGESKLSISGRSYPIFLDGEEHSNFLLRYSVSKRLRLDLEGFYDKYRGTDTFRTDFLFKTYMNEKV